MRLRCAARRLSYCSVRRKAPCTRLSGSNSCSAPIAPSAVSVGSALPPSRPTIFFILFTVDLTRCSRVRAPESGASSAFAHSAWRCAMSAARTLRFCFRSTSPGGIPEAANSFASPRQSTRSFLACGVKSSTFVCSCEGCAGFTILQWGGLLVLLCTLGRVARPGQGQASPASCLTPRPRTLLFCSKRLAASEPLGCSMLATQALCSLLLSLQQILAHPPSVQRGGTCQVADMLNFHRRFKIYCRCR